MIGGGIYGSAGFIGCMRHITIDGNYKLPSDWKDEEISSRDDIVLESCHVTGERTYFVELWPKLFSLNPN